MGTKKFVRGSRLTNKQMLDFNKQQRERAKPPAPPSMPTRATNDASVTAPPHTTRWNDGIEMVQHLIKTCRLPGLLAATWGTHSLSSEGPVLPQRDILTQQERDRRFDHYVRDRIPPMLEKAEPFFVDRELVDMIERSAHTLPPHTRLKRSLFKTSNGCLFFEKPIKMPMRRLIDATNHPTHEPAPLSGFAWECDDTVAILMFIYSWAADTTSPSWIGGTYIGNIPLAVSPWEFETYTLQKYTDAHNRAIHDHTNEDDKNNAERFVISTQAVVATLLLMDQVLTVVSTETVDRAARKRAERAGWKHKPTVQVVKLRRVDKVNLYEHTRDVEWNCRWRVREHFRTLARGTPQERTVLIPSYIKGPADKPFKPPSQRVWAVVR